MSTVYLRVKIKSLAEEARIIRREEQRFPRGHRNNELYFGLRSHRTNEVRGEARAALLAYGLLRGRRYAQIEATCHEYPNWARVIELVRKYGSYPSKAEAISAVMAWSDPLDAAAD
jgi:hypothetical protein